MLEEKLLGFGFGLKDAQNVQDFAHKSFNMLVLFDTILVRK